MASRPIRRATRPSEKARLARARSEAVAVSSSAELCRTITDSETSSPPKLKTFREFPAEIRLQIWHAAIVPRLVSLPPGSNKTPLALLGACKESRMEIGPPYREMFGFTNTADDERSGLWFRLFKNRESKGVIFNPNVDILMMGIRTARDLASYGTSDLQELRYVAIGDEDMVDESNCGTHIKGRFPALVDLFLKCPRLERLYLYLEDPVPYCRPDHVRYKERLEANLQRYIGEHLFWYCESEQDEEHILAVHGPEEYERLRKLVKLWEEVARVRLVSEIKTELGAASTEMIF